ncbi:MAG: hypothetical protein H0Z24_03295 [Thermosipho sp. (in: Bacteria)]|nr:hypothetical protein [Thermosipho sp. (in: thermotogales)]
MFENPFTGAAVFVLVCFALIFLILIVLGVSVIRVFVNSGALLALPGFGVKHQLTYKQLVTSDMLKKFNRYLALNKNENIYVLFLKDRLFNVVKVLQKSGCAGITTVDVDLNDYSLDELKPLVDKAVKSYNDENSWCYDPNFINILEELQRFINDALDKNIQLDDHYDFLLAHIIAKDIPTKPLEWLTPEDARKQLKNIYDIQENSSLYKILESYSTKWRYFLGLVQMHQIRLPVRRRQGRGFGYYH